MPNEKNTIADTLVFSLADGIVWVSWPGTTARVQLGHYDGVTDMMRNFLAQCELGERMSKKWGGVVRE
jgi:hypothetical protein